MLHNRQPDMYKDDNHKPEMCVAITQFEGLCCFLAGDKILANLRATPEIVAVVGKAAADELSLASAERPSLSVAAAARFTTALKRLFGALMRADSAVVTAQLQALVARLAATAEAQRADPDALALRLHAQYPGDVGVFCVYLLQHVVLQPGEAMYLAANEPHAYICGDCAEVMATSDNVVRAGLTPKLRDVDTLVEMLTYTDGDVHRVEPTQREGEPNVWRYRTPAPEFMMDRMELPAGGRAMLPAVAGLSVMVVVEGEAVVEQVPQGSSAAEALPGTGLTRTLKPGTVELICPGTALRVEPRSQRPLLLYRSAVREDE